MLIHLLLILVWFKGVWFYVDSSIVNSSLIHLCWFYLDSFMYYSVFMHCLILFQLHFWLSLLWFIHFRFYFDSFFFIYVDSFVFDSSLIHLLLIFLLIYCWFNVDSLFYVCLIHLLLILFQFQCFWSYSCIKKCEHYFYEKCDSDMKNGSTCRTKLINESTYNQK